MHKDETLLPNEADSILGTVTKRIQHIDRDGQRLWVKTIKHSKKRIGHRVQKLLAKLIPLRMLRVTVNEGGLSALKSEISRLDSFRKNGIHAPHVLYHTDTQIIMTDAGIVLQDVLDGETDEKKRHELLARAARILAEIHQKHLFHGRPYMKDFIYDRKTKTLGFIDLEEDPLQVMSAEEAQARDVWVFLAGVSSYVPDGSDGLLSYYEIYRSQAPEGFEKPLREFVQLLHPITRFMAKIFGDRLGRDVTKATCATSALQLYFESRTT